MDVYRALNVDVSQILITILHQASTMVTDEEYNRTVTDLQLDIRKRMYEVDERLYQWLEQQYNLQAEETSQKLQRRGLLSKQADKDEALRILLRDFSRLGSRIGSEALLSMQETAEESISEETPFDLDLAKRVADGYEYLATLGFKPGQGPIHEALLLFQGSVHYDVLEHILRDLLGIYIDRNVGHATLSTYNLVYQLGESLAAELTNDVMTQEITFAFDQRPNHSSDFRYEVSALMEHVGGHINLIHASFWQRKLRLGSGKEYLLRLRLPAGEEPLIEVINVIAGAGSLGGENVVKQGKLLLGKRVL